jgi:hypothetical protein
MESVRRLISFRQKAYQFDRRSWDRDTDLADVTAHREHDLGAKPQYRFAPALMAASTSVNCQRRISCIANFWHSISFEQPDDLRAKADFASVQEISPPGCK